MKDSNLAQLPFNETKDKDGTEGDVESYQVIIDYAENGYVLTVNNETGIRTKVFLFNGKGEDGPKGLIKDIIESLGLIDKVKLAE